MITWIKCRFYFVFIIILHFTGFFTSYQLVFSIKVRLIESLLSSPGLYSVSKINSAALSSGRCQLFLRLYYKYLLKYIMDISSSSSTSCRAGGTDIPDPLSPLFPVVHRPRQVFRTTSRILTTGDISILDGTPLKLVDKFTYQESSVASTEKDIDTRLTKAWTAINRLSIIWKSDLTDKMKRSFFQAVVTSILLYGCTTWTLTRRLEKKLDGNYTRMLRAILNKSWRQHPT